MTSIAKTLYEFYNSFGVSAYIEDHVPKEAATPYITYTVVEPPWDQPAMLQARIWDRSDSMAFVNRMVDTIGNRIGDGLRLDTGAGHLRLYKGSPFAQPQPIDNPDIRVEYLNIGMQAFTR